MGGPRVRLFKLLAISEYFVKIGFLFRLFLLPLSLVAAQFVRERRTVRHIVIDELPSILIFPRGVECDFPNCHVVLERLQPDLVGVAACVEGIFVLITVAS